MQLLQHKKRNSFNIRTKYIVAYFCSFVEKKDNNVFLSAFLSVV